MAAQPYDDDRQQVDQADDDAFVQHARDRRHHARRAARVRRRQPAELRVRAAGRHLLGRLSLDLLLGAARARLPQASARSGRTRAASSGSRRIAALPPARARKRRRCRAAAASAREDIVAARRERRQKAKAARRPRPVRRSAIASGAPMKTVRSPSRKPLRRRRKRPIDPLDAQKAGLHDAAFDQGHEEITLNLEDFDRAAARQAPSGRKKAAPALSALPPADAVGGRLRGGLRAFGGSAAAARLVDRSLDRRRRRVRRARLCGRATSICAIRYATIGDAARFHTKLVGVSFEGRQDIIAGLRAEVPLELRAPAGQSARPQRDRGLLRPPATRLSQHEVSRAPRAADRRGRALSRAHRLAHRRLRRAGARKHRGVNILVERDAQRRSAQRSRAFAAEARGREPRRSLRRRAS